MFHVATITVDQSRCLTRITDLFVAATASGPVLVSASYLGGGLASFAIPDADQPIDVQSLRAYPATFGHFGDPGLQSLQIDGQVSLTLTGLRDGPLAQLPLLDGGGLGPLQPLYGPTPLPRDLTQLGQFQTGGQTYLYAARQGDVDFTLYREAADGRLIRVTASQMPLAATMPEASLDKMIAVEMGGQQVLIAISGLGNFLSSHRIDGQGRISRADYLKAGDGTGFNVPNDVAAVTVDGQVYLIVTSARASSVTTVRLLPNGSMIPVDHIVDELPTRFQGATALATVEVDGRAYVFVGGVDDGISMFTVLPDGRLLHLETLVDDAAMTLADVSALAAQEVGGKIVLFVSSGTETGITQLSIDPGKIGLTGAVGSGLVEGGAGNDLLRAGRGTTHLKGGAGDDVLVCWREAIMIWGGDGRDLIVARPVQGRILILDFNPDEDRLDLSQLDMIRSIGQLKLVPFAKGIRLWFGETLIEIHSADGGTITADHFTNLLFPVAHYTPPDVETVIVGSTRGELLSATRGGSEIHGLAGHDVILDGEVEDLLIGDDGNDTIVAGLSNDTVQGGEGDDRLRGNAGHDQISGHAGQDMLGGDGGDDQLQGGDGADTLFGGSGTDSLIGGAGGDYLSGEGDDDRLEGGDGDDSLSGGDGTDWLAAGAGDNLLSGGSGDDTLLAGDGTDRLTGGTGADLIQSGDGDDLIDANEDDDRIFAGPGDDRVLAGTGDDTAEGAAGNDCILGGHGNDILQGDEGNDSVDAGPGDDLVGGGAGDDLLIGGAGLNRIEGGAGRDLLLGDALADTLLGGEDHDTIFGHGGADWIGGDNGQDMLFAGSGADALSGGQGSDRLFGGEDHDSLWGGADHDFLSGDSGDDLIEGGTGADLLLGGEGRDRFVFRSALDSTAAFLDRIGDFRSGTDLIDLTGFQLNFIGGQVFSAPAQLRLVVAVDHQLLQADLNGDGQADLLIRIDGTGTITGDDLLL